MKEERLKWRIIYTLALLVQVTYSSSILSQQCPNKLVSCLCPGEKHIKTKVSQCQLGAAGCQPCEGKMDVCKKLCAKKRKDDENSAALPAILRFRRDQNVKYICQKDGFIRTPSEQPGIPRVKLVSGLSREVFVDDTVVLRCEVLSQSTAQIIWSVQTAKQNRTLDPSKTLGTHRYRISDCGQEFHIQYAESSDSGKYICTVKNKQGLLEQSSSITVRARQDFGEALVIANVQLEDGSSQATVGSDISLSCHLYGVGKVQKIWFKDGRRISDDRKRIIWDYSGSSSRKLHKIFRLFIHNVSVEDGGTYTCIAKSDKSSILVRKNFDLLIGKDDEETAEGGISNVTIQHDSYVCEQNGVLRTPSAKPGLPQVKLPKRSQVEAFEKETVILNCNVRSHSSAHITWLIKNAVHEKELVPGESFSNSRYGIHNCGQELHIQYAGISDSGKYICTVENKQGSVEHISILEVKGPSYELSESRSRSSERVDLTSPIIIMLSSALGLMSLLLCVTVIMWLKSRRQSTFHSCTPEKL